VLGGLLNIHMTQYTYSGCCHYKDLPNLTHANTVVFVDTTAEDTYAYWLERCRSAGLVSHTIDITGVLSSLAANHAMVEDSGGCDVLLKVVVDGTTTGLAEELYHRGPHQVAWDFTDYNPGVAPIPEWVPSTPELTGCLTVGGNPQHAWRHGGFWMDAQGNTQGYPRMPGINNTTLVEDLWVYAAGDLGTVLEQTQPGRNCIWDTHWQQACISNGVIMKQTHSVYPHCRRFATEYRRRLNQLREAVAARRQ